jgi:class 3 adenylate cyclase/tetratricopeptide (TPR) repeat protein
MKCPKCQTDNPNGIKFCGECGAKLEKNCPVCGFSNPPQFKFCGECGHNLAVPSEPLPKPLSFDEKIEKIQKYLPKGIIDKVLSQRSKIEGERKEVTVMFCDMAGFTPLVEKIGAERAYAVMDQIYEILIHKVHEYEGTVNEMTGDGIMALFGAPIALENAPQRAIQSALAIHREITKFNGAKKPEGLWSPVKMRIGIHTGPVVVGTLGNDLRVEFKAVGETVNIASRMQTLAEPGTTYVNEEVFKLTEGFFRFESLGEKEVKGKANLVPVYQVLAPSTRSTRFEVNAERGLSTFIGRQRELELLLDGYDRVKAGRGQAFSIVAEAGVGKTRLVYEFRKALSNEDVAIREGKCLSYSRNEAYHPIVDVLRSYFDISDDNSEFEIKDKVRKALKTINGDRISLMPFLLELLKIKDSGIDAALSPEERKRRFTSALKQITLKGSEARPTILIIEDLHWMDKTSEEALREIFEGIAGSAVLLIFTYRPEYVHIWGAKTYHSQINLNRLSNRESQALVENLLESHEIDPVLQELILEKTEGVPFFIEELIKSLLKLNIIEKKENRYQLAKDLQKVAIPSTIQDVIMARVDALPERAKEVIQAGSAIEREFSHELINEIVQMTQNDLLSNLAVLKDLELIYERGLFPRSTYIFKHALTQEVVYGSIIKEKAKRYHEEIAQAMETLYADRLEEFYAALAFQYSQTENYPKASEFLKLAGDKALTNYSNQEADAFYKKALDALNHLPDTEENKRKRLEICFLIYGPSGYLGWPEGSLEILQQGEKIAEETYDKKSLAFFYSCTSIYHVHKGRPLEAIRYAEPKFYEATKAAEIELMAPLLFGLAAAYSLNGDFQKIIDDIPKVLKSIEKENKQFEFFGQPFNLYSLLCGLYANGLSAIGDFENSELFLNKGLENARKLNHRVTIGFLESYQGNCYAIRGDGENAVRHYENYLNNFKEGDFPWAVGSSLCSLGNGYWLMGDLETAKQLVQKGYDIQKNNSVEAFIPPYFLTLSAICHDLKEFSEAQSNVQEALKLSQKFGAVGFEVSSRLWSGRIAGKINPYNRAEAEGDIRLGMKILEKRGLKPGLAIGYFFLGELYANSGRKVEALENLNKSLSMCREMRIGYWPDKIQEVLDRL